MTRCDRDEPAFIAVAPTAARRIVMTEQQQTRASKSITSRERDSGGRTVSGPFAANSRMDSLA
jgi:hypothetical protein